MKNRPQKRPKRPFSAPARATVATPDPDAKPKWIDRQALFFVILIALIGLTSILFPLNFYLFAFNSQSSLPVPVQALWTLAAIGAVMLVARNTIPRVPGWTLYVAATISIVSFFILRTTYPTLIGDAGSGAMPKHFIIHWDLFPSMGRLSEFLCLQLSKLIPHSVGFFYHRSILYDNELMNNTSIIQTLIFACATVALLVTVLARHSGSHSERLGAFVLLAGSTPMLNGYGCFYSYIVSLFVISVWFIFLWLLHHRPTQWRLYSVLPILFALSFWTHPALWLLPGFMMMLLALIFLESRQCFIPFWLMLAGAVALGCAPLILMRSRADPYLANLRFDDTFGLHIYTRLLCCLEAAFPALILACLVCWQNRASLRRPAPIQAVALVSLISTVLLYFTSLIEMALYTVLSSSQYGAIIYGSSLVLYLTSRRRDRRHLFYSAIVGLYLFLPAAYVQSCALLFERQLRLFPCDRSSTTYQMWGPYLKLGLSVPIDTPDNRQRKLDAFRAGITTTIPDWQQFRGLNLMYYTAWCFEFGKYEEGNQGLIRLFNQHEALQALWRKGTQFTIWNENKAYKRIREASRRVIRDGLKQNPSNRYLQELSAMLDMYDQRDP